MKNIKVLLIFLFVYIFGNAQPVGYGFGKQILVNASQVSGGTPLLNFPMLLAVTDPDLRNTLNGGKVENANGFDILFTLGDCSTILLHDLESYNPFTGELVVWVQVPVLENAVNTSIFMFYGNSSVSASSSTTNIWTDVGYDGVWHLNNDFLDASGSGNNGVNNGSTNISPAHNSADGQNFVDPNHWIELPNHPNRTGSFSYSGWARTTNSAIIGQRIICDDQSNGNGCHALSIGDPGGGRIRFYIRNMTPVSLDSPGGTIINNTWHYVAATFDNGSNLKSLYVDGVLVNSGTVTGSLNPAVGNASIGGEVASGESSSRFNGDLDEIRSASTVLSANWIATEYNNQNSPSTFYSISSEMTASSLCVTLPIELIFFSAELNNNRTVRLEWETATEKNNDYFTIERSRDGVEWTVLSTVDGAGNSSIPMEYYAVDSSPFSGTSYYRLKQTDYDGNFEYFNVQSVELDSDQNRKIDIYPNPTMNQVIVEGDSYNLEVISIYNNLGQLMNGYLKISKVSQSKIKIDLSQLEGGVYILETRNSSHKIIKE